MTGDQDLAVGKTPARAVWVFAVDLPDPESRKVFFDRFAGDQDEDDWAVSRALGVTYLDEDFIEHFSADVLEPYGGLSRYLSEANGFDDPGLAEDAQDLGALSYVLLVYSQAFGGFDVQMSPTAPLRYVGRYEEAFRPVSLEPLHSDAAEGPLTEPPKKTPSQAAMSGRIASLALLVMFLLVGLMVWVAA